MSGYYMFLSALSITIVTNFAAGGQSLRGHQDGKFV